jgi:hypothetical protein
MAQKFSDTVLTETSQKFIYGKCVCCMQKRELHEKHSPAVGKCKGKFVPVIN